MPNGDRARRLQDMLPHSRIALARNKLREFERVDELIHQPPKQRRQENVVGNKLVTVERIATDVVFAMHSTDREISVLRGLQN